MAKLHVALSLLCAVPMLQSCSSVPLAVGQIGVQGLAAAREQSAEDAQLAQAHYQLGRYYQQQKVEAHALTAYAKALSLDPLLYEARNAMGVIYAGQGKYDLARGQFEAAIKQAPKAAHIHNNLGYAYYLQHEYKLAIAAFEAAIELEPMNERAWNNLGMSYAKAGVADKSRWAFEKAYDIRKKAVALGGSSPQAPAGRTKVGTTSTALQVSKTNGIVVRPDGQGKLHVTPPSPEPATSHPARPPESGAGPVFALHPVAPNVYELRDVAPKPVTTRPLNRENRDVVAAAKPGSLPVAGAEPPVIQQSMEMALVRLEVSNGNGTPGMAHRIAGKLRKAGLRPVRLTNQKPWQQASEIQFSPGYALEAAKLAGMLEHSVITVRNDALRPDIKLRLVLGKDVRSETAFLQAPHAPGLVVARAQ